MFLLGNVANTVTYIRKTFVYKWKFDTKTCAKPDQQFERSTHI